MKERNPLFDCTTHTFSRACQIYCIKNEIEFNNIISSFGVRADDISTLWAPRLGFELCAYLSPHLPSPALHTHTHNTHTLFYNKIAQEGKSGTMAACYSNHVSLYNLQLTGRSDVYRKRWLWNVCHETEPFINTPDKKKVRVHFSWPEWLLYITFGGSKPRQNEYYQVVMVTKLWLVPSNISLPSQGSCLKFTMRQGLRARWDSAGTFTHNKPYQEQTSQQQSSGHHPGDLSCPAPMALNSRPCDTPT